MWIRVKNKYAPDECNFIQELEELRSDPATNRYPEMIPNRKVVISCSIHMMMFVTKKKESVGIPLD